MIKYNGHRYSSSLTTSSSYAAHCALQTPKQVSRCLCGYSVLTTIALIVAVATAAVCLAGRITVDAQKCIRLVCLF
jgi:hypothetical protein